MADGADGAVLGTIVPVEIARLEPHVFEALTDTVPGPEPIVTVAKVDPCPAVSDHPLPATDHV